MQETGSTHNTYVHQVRTGHTVPRTYGKEVARKGQVGMRWKICQREREDVGRVGAKVTRVTQRSTRVGIRVTVRPLAEENLLVEIVAVNQAHGLGRPAHAIGASGVEGDDFVGGESAIVNRRFVNQTVKRIQIIRSRRPARASRGRIP